ncbi:P-loop containing nucleoside triphosphate hydrolase protein, partial [Mycena epipterygia]
MKELCADTVDIITVVRDQISAHGDTAAIKFKGQCEELERFLHDVVETVNQLQIKPRGFGAHIKEVIKANNTIDDISRVWTRIHELRSNFMLMATMDTNFQVQKVVTAMSPKAVVAQIFQPINNCPPPSRIFHGRQHILQQMREYFTQKTGKQDIFVLHGLGGAGKTQIALKFIEESASRFSNIFFIDSSSSETIETGLKNIAKIKSIGDSSQDSLQWLRSQQEEWLLFFDNADDPKLNLNNYFPQCTHGNILITSRNPGLCVYASSHSPVGDMEETDAVNLLLRSTAQDATEHNKATAAQIMKALHYLPLAIIQAGAFISRSGNLDSYLALYEKNRARLLSQRPSQSHDNYAWTVYTTWQISFEKLSQRAAMFLQLCSLLHHQGISEKIFEDAANYKFGSSSPSKEELQMPLEFLSQFVGTNGEWDSLCFMDVTSEVRAYSLINFDSERKLFSIHPLVHDWTRSTLSDEVSYHHCMVAIAGMSLAGLSEADIRLAVGFMLPHINFLAQHQSDLIPDFRQEYAKIYGWGGQLEKAEQLQFAVLQKRRNLMGGDHLDTLEAMYWLAEIYKNLCKFKEAEELEVVVVEQRKSLLGDNHPDTLHAMRNLAVTYGELWKSNEAEDLQVVVLKKQMNLFGDTHPDTLSVMRNLALTYLQQGKWKDAELLARTALEKERIILGDNHPDTLSTMSNLGMIYVRMGNLKEAEELEVVV